MEMECCRVRILNLRVVMMVVAEGDLDLFLVLTTMIDT